MSMGGSKEKKKQRGKMQKQDRKYSNLNDKMSQGRKPFRKTTYNLKLFYFLHFINNDRKATMSVSSILV